MQDTKKQFCREALPKVVDWVRRQTAKTQKCRECDLHVSMSETVCPRCGASDPARVPWSAVTAVFALCACVIIATMLFTT